MAKWPNHLFSGKQFQKGQMETLAWLLFRGLSDPLFWPKLKISYQFFFWLSLEDLFLWPQHLKYDSCDDGKMHFGWDLSSTEVNLNPSAKGQSSD